jgi:hypothetical protein
MAENIYFARAQWTAARGAAQDRVNSKPVATMTRDTILLGAIAAAFFCTAAIASDPFDDHVRALEERLDTLAHRKPGLAWASMQRQKNGQTTCPHNETVVAINWDAKAVYCARIVADDQ